MIKLRVLGRVTTLDDPGDHDVTRRVRGREKQEGQSQGQRDEVMEVDQSGASGCHEAGGVWKAKVEEPSEKTAPPHSDLTPLGLVSEG